MSTLSGRTAAALTGSALAGLALVAACGGTGTISYENTSGTAVTVTNAGDDLGEVPADGGGAVHTDECLGAPVVVTYDGGRVVELDRSLCPGQELRIGDGSVRVRPAGEGG